jgi:hypothetical protein
LPSTEQSERIVGAAFLGVPAFDSFVWLLDNYGRTELLVKLHNHLPPLLLNPGIGFVCMCLGLGLLYLSDSRQLRRVVNSSSTRHRILNSSGTEVINVEKPKWLLPVVLSFVTALIATPVVAIAYSLAYKGVAPGQVNLPRPPIIAYLKTPISAPNPAPPQQPQTPAGGISSDHDNDAALVNNGPSAPRFTVLNETEAENQDGTYTETYVFQVDAEVAPAYLTLQVTAEGLLKVRLLSHVEGNLGGFAIALDDVRSGEGFYSGTINEPSGRYDLAVTRTRKSKVKIAPIFK